MTRKKTPYHKYERSGKYFPFQDWNKSSNKWLTSRLDIIFLASSALTTICCSLFFVVLFYHEHVRKKNKDFIMYIFFLMYNAHTGNIYIYIYWYGEILGIL